MLICWGCGNRDKELAEAAFKNGYYTCKFSILTGQSTDTNFREQFIKDSLNFVNLIK